MAKIRIKGDTSGYVDLSAPDAASSSTLDLDQVPQKNVANTFTSHQVIRTDTSSGGYTAYPSLTLRNDDVNGYSVLHFNRGASTQSARIEVDNNNGLPTMGMYTTSSGGNGIKIDHNGYVTTPNQPSFHCHMSADQTISAVTWTKLTNLDTTRWNVGNHFNTSNSTFTAPIAGKYLFTAIVHFESSTNNYYYMGFKVNGSFYHYLYGFNAARSGADNTHGGSQIISLNANDTIDLWTYDGDGGSIGGNGERTHWTGYLLG